MTILLPPALSLVTRNSSGTEDSHHCTTADRVGDSAGAPGPFCVLRSDGDPRDFNRAPSWCAKSRAHSASVTGTGTVVVCCIRPSFRDEPDVRAALGPGTPRRDTASRHCSAGHPTCRCHWRRRKRPRGPPGINPADPKRRSQTSNHRAQRAEGTWGCSSTRGPEAPGRCGGHGPQWAPM